MYFLIGHRGVGKTTLLKDLNGGVDLDAEVLKTYDIHKLFEEEQEEKFRNIERQVLKEILKKPEPKFIVLGAGFEIHKFNFPKNSKIIWIQKKSDETGRIFLDRPRLDKNKTQNEEFNYRKRKRDKIYKKYAHIGIEIEEGVDHAKTVKNFLKKNKIKTPHGFCTIRTKSELDFMAGKVELRTDFFKEREIEGFLQEKCRGEILIALRVKPTDAFLKNLSTYKNILIDVPFEYMKKGYLEKLNNKNIFISEHNLISLAKIKEINKKGFHVKWAPQIKNFKELMKYHKITESMDVSFLPRSVGHLNGRWSWYRQLTFFKNKITFFRYGLNGYLDQPSFYELDSLNSKEFLNGGVVGEDVSLSHSPAYHRAFFKEKFKGTYVCISLYKDEFLKENLDFIKSLGVKFLSVTSPFKEKLGELSGYLKVANTLYINENLKVWDTDASSISFLKEELFKVKSVLIWGAGTMGVKIFKKIGKKAVLQSVRDYKDGTLKDRSFEVLIWSAGAECVIRPKLKVPPKVIYDLEYKDHSQAKAVALLWGCDYISGRDFFLTQAKAQQEFWLNCVEGRIK